MNSKHHKSDAFQVAIQLLAINSTEIYMSIEAVCAKRLNVERLYIKYLKLSTALLFANSSNHSRCKIVEQYKWSDMANNL